VNALFSFTEELYDCYFPAIGQLVDSDLRFTQSSKRRPFGNKSQFAEDNLNTVPGFLVLQGVK